MRVDVNATFISVARISVLKKNGLNSFKLLLQSNDCVKSTSVRLAEWQKALYSVVAFSTYAMAAFSTKDFTFQPI